MHDKRQVILTSQFSARVLRVQVMEVSSTRARLKTVLNIEFGIINVQSAHKFCMNQLVPQGLVYTDSTDDGMLFLCFSLFHSHSHTYIHPIL